MAYDQLDPFGEARADWRSAMVAAQVANAFRGKTDKALTAEDFMPRFESNRPRRTPEELEAMMQPWARMHNRRETQRRKDAKS